jgi:hypothetical protein
MRPPLTLEIAPPALACLEDPDPWSAGAAAAHAAKHAPQAAAKQLLKDAARGFIVHAAVAGATWHAAAETLKTACRTGASEEWTLYGSRSIVKD